MVFVRTMVICLLLVSCTAVKFFGGGTVIKVKMGHNDTYSSATGLLSRRMCRTDNVELRFRLSQEQLYEIGNLANQTGYFSLPSQLPSIQEDGSITVISPCSSYALDIYHAGHHRRVEWSCLNVHDELQPPQIRELYSKIVNTLEPSLSKLPKSKCIYY
jgi:hypothetical protein